jgi:radical SAM family protein/iron-sulfur cluster protein
MGLLRDISANAAYRLGLTRLPYAPILVSLEATNFCNLRCPMCPVGHHAHDRSVARGFMDEALFRSIVAELSTFKPIIAFHMGGESIMHPRFFQMVRTMADAGLFVRLDSNAVLISEAAAHQLVDSGLSEIYLDLDGHDAASYEAIRKRARFDRVIGNISTLLRVRRERGATVPRLIVKNIQYFAPGKPAGFPPAYKALFADNPPDEYRFAWADYWPGMHKDEVASSSDRYGVVAASVEPEKCSLLWSRLAIGWDGAVLVCCLDLNRTVILGNVGELGVLGAWNSPGMLDIRRAHVAGRQAELHLCATCNQIRRPQKQALLPSWLSTSREGGQGGEYRS